MARIRTIKPEFFRHEELQDLEAANPGKYAMMVFSALWGHCDNQGVFVYRPRQLKLDILPYLNFSMEETLEILEEAGFIETFTDDGKDYGFIQTFLTHQNLNGKEATEDGKKYPSPNGVKRVKKHTKTIQGSDCAIQGSDCAIQGSDCEKPVSQEGKGREGNRKGKELAPSKSDALVSNPDIDLQNRIKEAFLSRNGNNFTDWPKEIQGIKGIIKKARERSPEDPEGLIRQQLNTFWKKKSAGEKYWVEIPFLPSKLNCSANWDSLLETTRADSEPNIVAQLLGVQM